MKDIVTSPVALAILTATGLILSACAQEKRDAPPPPAKTETSVNADTAGIVAADFTLTDISGKPMKLSDYRGKVVIVDFWATWCPPCVKEIPHFNELSADFSAKGLVMLGVSVDQDGLPAIEKFRQGQPLNYQVALGSRDLYKTYQNYLPSDERGGIPFTFIIDKQGVIWQHFVGYREKEVFIEAIKPLL